MAPGPNSYRIRTPLDDARARRLAGRLPALFVFRRWAVAAIVTACGFVLCVFGHSLLDATVGIVCAVMGALMEREALK